MAGLISRWMGDARTVRIMADVALCFLSFTLASYLVSSSTLSLSPRIFPSAFALALALPDADARQTNTRARTHSSAQQTKPSRDPTGTRKPSEIPTFRATMMIAIMMGRGGERWGEEGGPIEKFVFAAYPAWNPWNGSRECGVEPWSAMVRNCDVESVLCVMCDVV